MSDETEQVIRLPMQLGMLMDQLIAVQAQSIAVSDQLGNEVTLEIPFIGLFIRVNRHSDLSYLATAYQAAMGTEAEVIGPGVTEGAEAAIALATKNGKYA